MDLSLDKLHEIKIGLLVLVSLGLSVFLFHSMMKAADNGNLIMVIVLAIAISIVAVAVSKAIRSYLFKKL